MNPIRTLLLISGILALMVHGVSGAITLETIYSFGHNTNADGASPYELIKGQDGNIYGSTLYGGPGGFGTVFKLTTNGTVTTLFGFNQTNGELPQGRLVRDASGVLYGTTVYGGTNGSGTVFKLTTNGVFTSLVSFTNNNQQPVWPYAGLVLSTNGLLYGLGGYGGSSGQYGGMFVTDTNGAMTTLAGFSGLNGLLPLAALLQGADGNFYAPASSGGSNGLGTIFRATPNGDLTVLVTMRGTNGSVPRTSLVQGQDGLLYGTTYVGGQNSDGVVYQMSLAGALTRIYSFGNFVDGANPETLVQAPDGMLYGVTSGGGTNSGSGTVFQLTTNGLLTSLHSMYYYEGTYPHGLALGADGVLYGAATFGGSNGSGSLFKVNTNGTLTSLFSFENPWATDGNQPRRPVQGPGGLFYGITSGGGAASGGTVFNMTTNGILKRLYSFIGVDDGTSPSSILVARDGQLYGTTLYGGSNDIGTIFKITTNGTFTTLHTFKGDDDGVTPVSLVQGIDDNFYGITDSGGVDNYGIVFRMTPSGTFTTLASFLTGGGQHPNTLLQRNDGTFYGTTLGGGVNGSGTIFKMTPAGVLSTIYDFNNSSGNDPRDLVAGADGNLYGTTESGGANGAANGTCYRVTTNGSFTILHLFVNGDEGYGPSSLTPGSDGNFYGTTGNGGSTGNGVLFRLKTNGTFTLLHSFDGAGDGGVPAGLAQGKDFKFYGTTVSSGSNSSGTFFRFSVPTSPSIAVQPSSITNHGGSVATFTVDADGVLPLKYQWRKNLINLTNGGTISGTTSATLSLSNVTPTDNGGYSVVITNNFGSATSSNATLTVLPTLSEALDTSNLIWLTGGDADWFGQPWITHDGVDAAQSGTILDWEESWLQTTVNGPGVLTFWWKVSSESGYDFLDFFVNSQMKASISGETGWQQQTINVPSGSQPLLWVYEKDFSFSFGADRGWVDQVSFVPAPVFQQLVRSNNTLILNWSTVPGHSYQLQFTTNLVQTNWINLGSPVTNGSVSTPIGPERQRFYRVLLLP